MAQPHSTTSLNWAA